MWCFDMVLSTGAWVGGIRSCVNVMKGTRKEAFQFDRSFLQVMYVLQEKGHTQMEEEGCFCNCCCMNS